MGIDNIVISMIKIIIKVVTLTLKFLPKLLIFTGLWGVIAGIFLIESSLMEIPILGVFIGLISIFLIFAVPIYSIANNVIRIGKQDPSFNLLKIFPKRENKKAKGTGTREHKSLKPKGFIFGKSGLHYINKREDKDGHIAVLGGAGSGKSSAIAIPSLISWQNPVFAIDIKGELTEKTRKFRLDHSQKVKVFNPLDPNSYGFDPFEILRTSKNLVQDTREIVNAIIPLKPEEKDPFWTESAQNVLSSAILYAYDNQLGFNGAIELVTTTSLSTFFELVESSHNPKIKMFTSQLKGLKEQTLSSIGQTLNNRILPFATDSDLISVFNRPENISPSDLEDNQDIYIQIPEDKIEQWQGLLTLIVNAFLKAFERRDEQSLASTPKPILFALDEFPRLGKVQTITNGLATLRSKQITIALFMQSMAQLDLIYGKETRQVIFDNCQYKAILRATDQDTQEYLSKLVGTYDKIKKSTSASFGAFSKIDTGSGTSKTTEEKRIIKPEEFATLEDIVLLTPKGFQRIEKASYWKDKNFH